MSQFTNSAVIFLDIFFKNPLTPSVPQPGTPKSNYESNLRTTPLLREKMFKIFIQLGRETVVAKCLILYVTQASIPRCQLVYIIRLTKMVYTNHISSFVSDLYTPTKVRLWVN